MDLKHFTLLALLCVACAGCGRYQSYSVDGDAILAPADFGFLTEKHPCYLRVSGRTDGIRVNCFHLDGVLHIHSSRWAKLPRFGPENWVVTVARDPNVRILIDGNIYEMQGTLIKSETERVQILENRGYWHPWDGITVVRFTPK